MNVSEKIKDLRVSANMTQQALADLLFVSRELVAKWEQGRGRPDHGMLSRICVLFKKPDGYFISKDDELYEELSACMPDGADVGREELTRLLNAFLRGIDQRSAKIFIERYVNVNGYTDIASALGMKENHVRSVLSKTRKKLKNYLERELK